LLEEHFDVLVTDVKMPGLGGMDVLAFVNEHCASTKVIVITGFATVETANRAFERGAVDFIAKPFKMSYLRDLVVRLAEGGYPPTPPIDGKREADGTNEPTGAQ
jgi:DNA-binding NtrC family response regulator